MLGQAVLFSLYGKYPVSDVAPFMLLIPIFTGLFSIFVQKESISTGLIVGGVIVLFGVWVQQTGSRRRDTGLSL